MKKTLTALTLLATLNANNVQASETLFSASQEIHQEAGAIFAQQSSAKARFEKLTVLTEQIGDLNQWLAKNEGQLQAELLDVLLIVNGVLDFTFHQFKNKYEKLIYAHHLPEFRQFSSQRNAFKMQLKQLNDRIKGITFVEVEGVTLSEKDVHLISQQAKVLEEKILNAC